MLANKPTSCALSEATESPEESFDAPVSSPEKAAEEEEVSAIFAVEDNLTDREAHDIQAVAAPAEAGSEILNETQLEENEEA